MESPVDIVHNWNFLWWYPNSPFPSSPAMGEVLLSLFHLPCPEGCLFSPLPPHDSCLGEGIGVICMLNSAIHWWVMSSLFTIVGLICSTHAVIVPPVYMIVEWECECCTNEGHLQMFFRPIATPFEWLILFCVSCLFSCLGVVCSTRQPICLGNGDDTRYVTTIAEGGVRSAFIFRIEWE